MANARVRQGSLEGLDTFVAERMGPDARATFDLQMHGDKECSLQSKHAKDTNKEKSRLLSQLVRNFSVSQLADRIIFWISAK